MPLIILFSLASHYTILISFVPNLSCVELNNLKVKSISVKLVCLQYLSADRINGIQSSVESELRVDLGGKAASRKYITLRVGSVTLHPLPILYFIRYFTFCYDCSAAEKIHDKAL